jgi:hypothetical protein
LSLGRQGLKDRKEKGTDSLEQSSGIEARELLFFGLASDSFIRVITNHYSHRFPTHTPPFFIYFFAVKVSYWPLSQIKKRRAADYGIQVAFKTHTQTVVVPADD